MRSPNGPDVVGDAQPSKAHLHGGCLMQNGNETILCKVFGHLRQTGPIPGLLNLMKGSMLDRNCWAQGTAKRDEQDI